MQAARRWGRERKSSYDSGDGYSAASGTGLFLSATSVQNFPGKPLSETWRLQGSDLGALCQVLFVPGITSLDYCLTTSPSLPQSLSPPPLLGCSRLCPEGQGTAWSRFRVFLVLKYDSKDPHRAVLAGPGSLTSPVVAGSSS